MWLKAFAQRCTSNFCDSSSSILHPPPSHPSSFSLPLYKHDSCVSECAAIGIPTSPMRWNASIRLSPLYVLFQHKAQDKLHIEECYYWEKSTVKFFFFSLHITGTNPFLCNLSEKSAGLQCPRSERKRPSSYTQITSISPVFINRTS